MDSRFFNVAENTWLVKGTLRTVFWRIIFFWGAKKEEEEEDKTVFIYQSSNQLLEPMDVWRIGYCWLLMMLSLLKTSVAMDNDEDRQKEVGVARENCLDGEEQLQLFRRFLIAGHTNTIRYFIHVAGIEPPMDAMVMACYHGHVEIVELLLHDRRSPPDVDGNWPMIVAAMQGHLEVVRLLMSDPRVDPSAREQAALLAAIRWGNRDLVELLLQDIRVDPSRHDHFALLCACQWNRPAIVQLLLKDPRVDPTARRHQCFMSAVYHQHQEVVQLLLNDGRLDPERDDQDPLVLACFQGAFTIVRLLLHDILLRPQLCYSEALSVACFRGHVDIVRLLLHDGQADPRFAQSFCLLEASREGRLDIVKALLEDRRVRELTTLNQAFTEALRHRHLSVLHLLLETEQIGPASFLRLVQDPMLLLKWFVDLQLHHRRLLPLFFYWIVAGYAGTRLEHRDRLVQLVFARWASRLEHWPLFLSNQEGLWMQMNILWNRFVKHVGVLQRWFKHVSYQPGSIGFKRAQASFNDKRRHLRNNIHDGI